MKLARFPRVRLTHAPTPLEPMGNLTRLLGGPNLWIKRDDCTGLSTGGNKTRKLEFLMGEALAKKADIVVTQGATQSNHARQTAALPRSSGCSARSCWRTAPAPRTTTTTTTATSSSIACLAQPPRACRRPRHGRARRTAVADQLRAARRYVIPGGGSNPIGALGYVTCALELAEQANDLALDIDLLVHATGSTGTQAGLLAGSKARAGDSGARNRRARAEAGAGGEGVCARRTDGRDAGRTGHGEARATSWPTPVRG